MSKLNVEHHIEVEIKMDEMDLTAAEKKATYEEIKNYVLKQTGLKVSSLYIAQVKQKCGIIERINYNPPKSENSCELPKKNPLKTYQSISSYLPSIKARTSSRDLSLCEYAS